MQTKIIEATNGFNWGKFLLGRLDSEWSVKSLVDQGRPLLNQLGWFPDYVHLWVLDLQTGEGAYFHVGGGSYRYDLQKHKIWVCPLFEPFLAWLYEQDVTQLEQLTALVYLPNAASAIWGHRRSGPSATSEDRDEQSEDSRDRPEAKDARVALPRVRKNRKRKRAYAKGA